jgi:hypothetical protein
LDAIIALLPANVDLMVQKPQMCPQAETVDLLNQIPWLEKLDTCENQVYLKSVISSTAVGGGLLYLHSYF